MNGIPTMFNGRRYRSRLEARWAAFFTLIGWRFEYEPCDFDGWIPDFALVGKEQSVFVEVKPIGGFSKDVVNKIDASNCVDECLLLGLTFPLQCVDGWDGVLGFLREDGYVEIDANGGMNDPSWWWDAAILSKWSCGTIGFCHSQGSYTDRISGTYDGGSWGIDQDDALKVASRAWTEAGNAVQWRKHG